MYPITCGCVIGKIMTANEPGERLGFSSCLSTTHLK